MLMVRQSGHYLVKCWCHSHLLFEHSPGGEKLAGFANLPQVWRRLTSRQIGFFNIGGFTSSDGWEVVMIWILDRFLGVQYRLETHSRTGKPGRNLNQKDKKHICPMSKGTAYQRLIFNIPWWVSGVVTPTQDTMLHGPCPKSKGVVFFCWGSLWTFGCWNNFPW